MFEGQFWVVKDAFTARKFLEKVDELVEKHDRIEFQWITDKNRSALQNRAMHVYFQNISTALNNAGFTFTDIFEDKVDGIAWTPQIVKDAMWRKVMEAQTGKTSTRDLTTSEVSQVFDILNQYLSSKGINVGFPER